MSAQRLRRVIVAASLCAVVAGCGTTVIDAQSRDARIFIDGQPRGQGRATVRRTGFPAEMDVRVEYASGEVQTRHVERDITAVTVVAALCTYFTGLFWAQQYPDDVLFSPDPRASERSLTGPSGWALSLDTNPWLVGTITAPPTAAAPTSTPEP